MEKNIINQKLILFGAGAEIPFGMPSGGRFALQVLSNKRDSDIWNSIKDELNKVIDKQVKNKTDYSEWLGEIAEKDLRLTRPQSQELENIFKSIISENRDRIKNILENIDSLLDRNGFDKLSLQKNLVSLDLIIPGQETDILDSLNKSNPLGRLISHALHENTKTDESNHIWLLIRMFVELAYAILGVETARKASQPNFNKKLPSELSQNLDNIFKINFGKLGIDAIKHAIDVSEIKEEKETNKIQEFCNRVILDVISNIIDYQELMEKYIPALYRPYCYGSSMFLKAIMLLTRMKIVIEEDYKNAKENLEKGNYYKDMVDNEVNESFTIASTNYTNLVCDITRQNKKNILWLNGHIDYYLNPYTNSVDSDINHSIQNQVLIPYLIPQSVIKPMMTSHSIETYFSFYSKLKKCNEFVILGYGLGAVDSHINSIIRESIITNSQLKVIIFIHVSEMSSKNNNQKYARKLVQKRLRIEKELPDNVKVVILDDQRKSNGKLWINCI